MSRTSLAFRCFFRLLFGGTLPAEAASYLPESPRPALPPPAPDDKDSKAPPARQETSSKARAEPAPARTESPLPSSTAGSGKAADQQRDGALALLALFQREGRLIDFLHETLDDYDDRDIAAAVRDIHRGCHKVLTEHLTIEPVMPGEEEANVTIPKGFDPGEVRLIGEVAGEPPFRGTLRHHGWRVTRTALPTLSEGVDRHVLAPAEVEVS